MTEKPVSIKRADYLVCPECGHHNWAWMYKVYAGKVYCKNSKCNIKFDPKPVNMEEYSIHVFTTDKNEMIRVLQESLDKLTKEN